MQRCYASLQLGRRFSEEPDVEDYDDEDHGEVGARELEERPRGLRRLVYGELYAIAEDRRAKGGGRDDVEWARRVGDKQYREREDDQERAGERDAHGGHPLVDYHRQHGDLRRPVLLPFLDREAPDVRRDPDYHQ